MEVEKPHQTRGKLHYVSYSLDAIMDPAENNNLPFVEKFRPDTLEEIISHKEITNTSSFKYPNIF